MINAPSAATMRTRVKRIAEYLSSGRIGRQQPTVRRGCRAARR
jgi:hypothetical protein